MGEVDSRRSRSTTIVKGVEERVHWEAAVKRREKSPGSEADTSRKGWHDFDTVGYESGSEKRERERERERG